MTRKILPHHQSQLAQSAISPLTSSRAYLSSIEDASDISQSLNRSPGWAPAREFQSCLVFPYGINYDGSSRHVRLRPDHPRRDPNDENKVVKYEQRYLEKLHLYIPYWDQEWWSWYQDASKPLWIVEGEKKALSLLQIGCPAISVPGIWTGTPKDEYGQPRLHADFSWVPIVGRTVIVCFDKQIEEATDKGRDVAHAAARLLDLLQRAGANSYIAFVPGPQKGIDDWIYEHGQQAFYDEVVRFAQPMGSMLDNQIWHRDLMRTGASVIDRVKHAHRTSKIIPRLWPGAETQWYSGISQHCPDLDAEAIKTGKINPRPWSREVAGSDQYYVFADGTKVYAGSMALEGTDDYDIARYMISRFGAPVITCNKQTWIYSVEDDHWKPIEHHDLCWTHIKSLQHSQHIDRRNKSHILRLNERLITRAASVLQQLTKIDDGWFQRRPGTAFRNGFLSKENYLMPNDPSNAATYVLGGNFDINSPPQSWEKLIQGTSDPGDIEAWVGAALRGDRPETYKTLVLTGPGNVEVGRAIAALWPSESISTVHPDNFSNHAVVQNMRGKSLNYVEDVESEWGKMRSVASIQNVLTGKPITTGTYKLKTQFVSTAAQLWVLRSLPTHRDLKPHMLVVHCDEVLPIDVSHEVGPIASRCVTIKSEGYGNDLHAVRRWIEKFFKTTDLGEGLTLEEIWDYWEIYRDAMGFKKTLRSKQMLAHKLLALGFEPTKKRRGKERHNYWNLELQ